MPRNTNFDAIAGQMCNGLIRYCLLALLLSIPFLSTAQVKTSTMLLGGMGNFNYRLNQDDDRFSFAVAGNYGKTMFDNFYIGGFFEMAYFHVQDQGVTTYALGPNARFYFGKSGLLKPFLQLEGGFFSVSGDISSGGEATFWGIGPGLAIFLTDQVALEGVLKYQRASKEVMNKNAVGLYIGLQSYIMRY